MKYQEKLNEMLKYSIDMNAKVNHGEVFTPIHIIEEMLDCFDENDWANPDLKWLDPANGTGNFIICIVNRLMIGLKIFIPDEIERLNHIMQSMIYVCEIQEKNMNVYKSFFDIKNINAYTVDYLKYDDFNVKFDRIVGNPPYQEMDGGFGASAKPIYNLFLEKSLKISNDDAQIMFITPSRWFSGGKGLDSFRKFMLTCNKLKMIKHFDYSVDIFGKGVNIKGGISYFIFDKNYNGDCLFNKININLNNNDIILLPKHYVILSKLNKFDCISKYCMLGRGGGMFGIKSNDKRFVDTIISENYIKCYVSKMKGGIKYIDKTTIKKSYDFYKVITPRTSGNGNDGFGSINILNKNEVCSDTYTCFCLKTIEEATSLAFYLKSKLANYLLSLRKITQHINTTTLNYIPLVTLDKMWDDELLYEYFKLDDNDIKIINEDIFS